ncbi:MAG: hypothetical protein KC800_19165 [Candidatus Eremiobacteraeota bacterium]|nr:hypothetical protein [Candidatus Eremiobacteraeota bacterium]
MPLWFIPVRNECRDRDEDVALRKKAVFAIFLAFFVLFGGGRSGEWVIVCHDQAGWTYQVDLRSLENRPDGKIACRVRTHQGEVARENLWLFDRQENTLQIEDGPVEEIRHGSVALRVVRFLDHQPLEGGEERSR